MGIGKKTAQGYDNGNISYLYRPAGSDDWEPLGGLNYVNGEGFNPYTVDPQKSLVYGFFKLNGRQALISLSLAEASLSRAVVISRPGVDVGGLISIGKRQRVGVAARARYGLCFGDGRHGPASARSADATAALPQRACVAIVGALDRRATRSSP